MQPFTGYVVGFQYKAAVKCDVFQILLETPSGLKHLNSRLEATDTWRWHFVDVSKGQKSLREPVNWLRLDLGNDSDRKFQFRDLRLIKSEPDFDISKLAHVPFTLKKNGNHVEIKSLPNGEFQISTTGDDPYISTDGLTKVHDPATPYIIAFEYQAPPEFGDIVFHYRTSEKITTLKCRSQALG